jgi:hypothetical protein
VATVIFIILLENDVTSAVFVEYVKLETRPSSPFESVELGLYTGHSRSALAGPHMKSVLMAMMTEWAAKLIMYQHSKC